MTPPSHLQCGSIKACNAGSALFLILIAVVLFAALTYAITQSNRGDGNSMSKEGATIQITRLFNFGSEVRAAVNKLLLKGCSIEELSFENDTVGGYTNANSPSNRSCHIFDIAGGGVAFPFSQMYQANNELINTYGDFNWNISCNRQMGGIGVEANDDMRMVYFIRRKQICDAINIRAGIFNMTTIPEGFFHWSNYTGVCGSGGGYFWVSGITPTQYIGKSEGCYAYPLSNGGGYLAYMTLIDR